MANKHKNAAPENQSEMSSVMERNIKELIKLRQNEEKEKSNDEHIADHITGFAGTMAFVYFHVVVIIIYMLWNSGRFGLRPFDPTFTGLSTIASIEAIFLATFVLIRQNRMNKLAEKRANLELQVSLLTEHEVTRLLTLVTAIARKLEIAEADNPNYDDLKHEVKPEKVLETIDKHKQQIIEENGIDY